MLLTFQKKFKMFKLFHAYFNFELTPIKFRKFLPRLEFSTHSYLLEKNSDKKLPEDEKKNNKKPEDENPQTADEKKKYKGSEFFPGPEDFSDPIPDETRYRKTYSNPAERIYGIMRDDLVDLRGKIKNLFAAPGEEKYVSKDHFPPECDVLVIGGGIMGASIAYHIKEFTGSRDFQVVIVEKDTSYSKASTALSIGGIRQQFNLYENIQLSKYGFDFLQKANQLLSIPDKDPPDIRVNFGGYLTLANEEQAPILLNNFKEQRSLGADVLFLTKKQINERFPWIKTDGIEGGVYGIHGEGWFDPWTLLHALIRKCRSLGTTIIEGEVVNANVKRAAATVVHGGRASLTKLNDIDGIEVKLSDGTVRNIRPTKIVLATGAWSGGLGYILGIGKGETSLFSVPLPVVPRKRYVYSIRSGNDGPGLDCPLVVDTNGTYFRREGLGNVYLCGASPLEEEEPPTDDLSVDYSFFERKIWPTLAKRVEAFNSLKVINSWGGYYDYNTFDQNGFVGIHPCYTNLYLACGFSGHGLQHAPGIGLATREIIFDGAYTTLNLERLSFERLFFNNKLEENIV